MGCYPYADHRAADSKSRCNYYLLRYKEAAPLCEVFLYLVGTSAERLAASMLRYTSECRTIAIASAQAISINSFSLRGYIFSIPVLAELVPKRGISKICTPVNG